MNIMWFLAEKDNSARYAGASSSLFEWEASDEKSVKDTESTELDIGNTPIQQSNTDDLIVIRASFDGEYNYLCIVYTIA